MIINKLRSWLQVMTVKALTTVLSSTTKNHHHQKLPLTDIFEMMANLAMSAKETSEQEEGTTTSYNPAPLLRFHINAIFNLLSTAETLVIDKDNPSSSSSKVETKSIEQQQPLSPSLLEQQQQLPSFYATVSNQEMVDEVNSWLNVKVLSLITPPLKPSS